MSSFSIVSTWPTCTLYCLPPVTRTAYTANLILCHLDGPHGRHKEVRYQEIAPLVKIRADLFGRGWFVTGAGQALAATSVARNPSMCGCSARYSIKNASC